MFCFNEFACFCTGGETGGIGLAYNWAGDRNGHFDKTSNGYDDLHFHPPVPPAFRPSGPPASSRHPKPQLVNPTAAIPARPKGRVGAHLFGRANVIGITKSGRPRSRRCLLYTSPSPRD